MCWSGLAIDWVCEHHCQPSLQGAANVFFILIFCLVFVDISVLLFMRPRGRGGRWQAVCLLSWRESPNLPSFKAAADRHQKLRAHLVRELRLSEKPNSHFPELTSPVTYPLASLFRQKIFHFWSARRSSLPSLDRLRPGTELIHTHRRKGSRVGTPSIIRSVATAHAQLSAAASRCLQLSKAQRQLHAVHSVSWTVSPALSLCLLL